MALSVVLHPCTPPSSGDRVRYEQMHARLLRQTGALAAWHCKRKSGASMSQREAAICGGAHIAILGPNLPPFHATMQDVIFRVEHSGACNSFCCFSRWCCLQPKLIVHMQDWEIGVITLPMFGSFFKVRRQQNSYGNPHRASSLSSDFLHPFASLFQPVYYIRDSGGVEIRVVGRPGIHHNVTVCFKIQEQRAGKWVDIGSIERRCTEDPLKKGAIGTGLMFFDTPGLWGV